MTGLPELPEGYRWKIDGPRHSLYLGIRVQSQNVYGGWEDTETYGVVRKSEATPEAILSSAEYALKSTPLIRPVPDDSWKKFIGTYPPKTLGERVPA